MIQKDMINGSFSKNISVNTWVCCPSCICKSFYVYRKLTKGSIKSIFWHSIFYFVWTDKRNNFLQKGKAEQSSWGMKILWRLQYNIWKEGLGNSVSSYPSKINSNFPNQIRQRHDSFEDFVNAFNPNIPSNPMKPQIHNAFSSWGWGSYFIETQGHQKLCKCSIYIYGL